MMLEREVPKGLSAGISYPFNKEGNAQFRSARDFRGHNWEAVILSAESPDDGPWLIFGVRKAGNLVNSRSMTSRNEIITVCILVESVDVAKFVSPNCLVTSGCGHAYKKSKPSPAPLPEPTLKSPGHT